MAGLVVHFDSASVADSAASVGAPPSDGSPSASSGKNEWRATVKPHGLLVTFEDVGYSIRQKTQKITILKHVTGYFEPGNMTAVVGPSGSGKTTFLDSLAGRKTAGQLIGKIKFGGLTPTPALVRRATGYVEQCDTLVGALTVSEMLMYTAQLKRPIKEGQQAKREAVQHLIEKLALTSCSNTPIGSTSNRRISGGQAKRVNMGIALITDPRVLFLDEPTSGLDSYTSKEVMGVVKCLTKDGTTVAATIHSPSSSTYSLFDQVMVLLAGRVVYFGCPQRQAISFFTKVWSARGPVLGDNLAEWMLDLVVDADRKGQAAEAAALYETSELSKDCQAQLGDLLAAARNDLQSSPSTLAELQEVQLDQLDQLALANLFSSSTNLVDGPMAGEPRSGSSSYDGGSSSSSMERGGSPLRRCSHDSGCVRRIHPVAVPAGSKKAAGGPGQAVGAAAVGSPLGGGQRFWGFGKTRNGNTTTTSSSSSRKGPKLLARYFAKAGALINGTNGIGSITEGSFTSSTSSSSSRYAGSPATAQPKATYITPWWWSFGILFRYRTLKNYSTLNYHASHVADKLVFALVLMSLFWAKGDNFNMVNVPGQASLLFLLVGAPAWCAVAYVPTIVSERLLFIRERNDGLYRPIVYLAHKLVEELLLMAPVVAINCAIVWAGVHLQGSFTLFWLTSYATLANGIGLAYFVSALSSSMSLATAAVPTLVSVALLFCGFIIRRGAVPSFYVWLVDINPFHYSWSALMINQFDEHRNALLGGFKVLNFYGLDQANPWAYMGYLWAFFVGWVFASWLALSFRRYHRR